MMVVNFFFFSSRRRHTRCLSDWSSDVCSSDLPRRDLEPWPGGRWFRDLGEGNGHFWGALQAIKRSEERRVGKECRSRWSTYQKKKNKKNIQREEDGRWRREQERARIEEDHRAM